MRAVIILTVQRQSMFLLCFFIFIFGGCNKEKAPGFEDFSETRRLFCFIFSLCGCILPFLPLRFNRRRVYFSFCIIYVKTMAVSIVMVVKLWLYQFSAKINMSRNSPVLSREYSSTLAEVLQYSRGSTAVLCSKYWSASTDFCVSRTSWKALRMYQTEALRSRLHASEPHV